jgi:hypothetical protein
VKKKEYEYARVKEYYILDDRKKETACPDFGSLSPDLAELVKDEVYQGFVMVKYQAEQKKAAQEKVRADQVESQLILVEQEKEEALSRRGKKGKGRSS